MKLIVIVLGLLSERFLIHRLAQHRFVWFPLYQQKMLAFFSKKSGPFHPFFLLVLSLLPLVIATAVVLWVSAHLFFGFFRFFFDLILFYYCLGPQNPFYPIRLEESLAADVQQLALRGYFSGLNEQLFAVIFWYLFTGPLGMLFYRLVSLTAAQKEYPTQTIAQIIKDFMDWPAARMMLLLCLLVGNFQKGFPFFSHNFFSSPQKNDFFLGEGSALALNSSAELSLAPLPLAEKLAEHALILLLFFIALFTLAAWF